MKYGGLRHWNLALRTMGVQRGLRGETRTCASLYILLYSVVRRSLVARAAIRRCIVAAVSWGVAVVPVPVWFFLSIESVEGRVREALPV